MQMFFNNGNIGIAYFISYVILIIYLCYLSIVDIKKHELQYWQTGGLFVFSAITTILNIIATNNLALSINAQHPSILRNVTVHLGASIVVFILMLTATLIKKNGNFAFGGADIWALTAVSLFVGIYYIQYMLIATCISYLIYALFYKLKTKNKVQKVAFLPFISIGALFASLLFMI